MSISGKEWKAGRTNDSKEAKIIRFLKSHYRSEEDFDAYTWTELAVYADLPENATPKDASVNFGWQVVLAGVSLLTKTSFIDTSAKNILEDLVQHGEVVKQQVVDDYDRPEVYYRYAGTLKKNDN